MTTYCDHCGLPVGEEPIRGGGPGAPDAAENQNRHDGLYCCYGCRMLGEAGTGGLSAADDHQQSLLIRVFAGGLMAAFVMVLSLAISSGYGFAAFRALEHDVSTAHWVLLLVAVPALLLLGLPVARSAASDLRQRRLSLHVLFALGTGSAVAVSAVSYVRGTGPIYIETAVMLLALYTLGRYLTARAKSRTTSVLGHLLDVPDMQYERLSPQPDTVRLGSIQPGDVIRVAAGDVVPVDGVVERGSAYVDESSLTGEARPSVRSSGDPVYAGTAPVDGPLVVEATAVGEDRRLAQVEQMMRRALERPPRLQRLTDRIMRVLIPGVVVLALATFAGWYVAAGFEKALYTALSVVLITCPCALGIAIPLSLVVGLGEAARDGVLVRDGDALLDLAHVDTVLFDKTGTLTTLDAPSLEVIPAARAAVSPGGNAVFFSKNNPDATPGGPGWTTEQAHCLRIAAGLETTSRHPIGRAVEEAAGDLTPAHVEDAETIPGAGVTGTVRRDDGTTLRAGIGNHAVVERLGAQVPDDLRDRFRAATDAGKTAMYVIADSRAVGLITLTEQIRAGARRTVDRLQEQGVAVHVLTGDRQGAARRIEETLGVTVDAEQTPEDKVAHVEDRQSRGEIVAMVGDGINDAAAIAAADLGLARTDGAGVSIDAAGIALYPPEVGVVADLHHLAVRTRRIVHQNLWWTFGYNAAGLGLAVAGLLHPIAAVTVMAVSSAAVTWNAFRLRRTGKG